jgi:outer membrane biosynthesis protein TonB
MRNALKAGAARHDENVVSSSRRGRRVCRRLAVGALAVASLAGATACTTTKAATPVERPALEVPPPPPRVVEPTPVPPPQLQPVESLGPGAPPAPSRPRPPAKDAQKPDPKPEEPKPVEPAPPPTQPPPVLRMPETANTAQLTTQIQEAIARSKAILGGVDYRRLSPVAVKAYKESQMFAQQAEDALKANNLPFAKELADKAERLARELQGR